MCEYSKQTIIDNHISGKEPISHIEIIRVNKVSLTESYLEFLIWLDTSNSLNFISYRCIMGIDEGYCFLNNLLQLRIPSNYYMFQLRDKNVIACLEEVPECSLNQLDEVSSSINRIEIFCEAETFNSVVLKLVQQGAWVRSPYKEDVFPLNNMVFNRNNLDISVRYVEPEEGFHTLYLHKIFANDVLVRTLKPLSGITCIGETTEFPDYYDTVLKLSSLSNAEFQGTYNGFEISPHIITLLGIQTVIKIFAEVFHKEVALNAAAAMVGCLSEPEVTSYQKHSEMRTPSNKICTISPLFSIPTQKMLRTLYKDFNLDESNKNLDDFLGCMQDSYGDIVTMQMSKVLSTLGNLNGVPRYTMARTLTEQLRTEHALTGLKAHALKSVLCTNPGFMQAYSGSEHILKSNIFNAGISIKTYPVPAMS